MSASGAGGGARGHGSVGGRLDGLTSAAADWSDLDVVVAGLGVSGFAAADALHDIEMHKTGAVSDAIVFRPARHGRGPANQPKTAPFCFD